MRENKRAKWAKFCFTSFCYLLENKEWFTRRLQEFSLPKIIARLGLMTKSLKLIKLPESQFEFIWTPVPLPISITPDALESKDKDQEKLICIGCSISAINVVFLPCRHAAFCHACIALMPHIAQQCAICNETVRSVLQINGYAIADASDRSCKINFAGCTGVAEVVYPCGCFMHCESCSRYIFVCFQHTNLGKFKQDKVLVNFCGFIWGEDHQ